MWLDSLDVLDFAYEEVAFYLADNVFVAVMVRFVTNLDHENTLLPMFQN